MRRSKASRSCSSKTARATQSGFPLPGLEKEETCARRNCSVCAADAPRISSIVETYRSSVVVHLVVPPLSTRPAALHAAGIVGRFWPRSSASSITRSAPAKTSESNLPSRCGAAAAQPERPAAGGGRPTRLLPDDLNISWEYTQPSSGAEGGNGGKVTLQVESSQAAVSGASGNASFQLCATGKRPQGIGTENVRQEIVTAERGDGSVVLRVTLLAAGFVVGPNGSSIHQIEAITGASIYSFNRQKDSEVDRPTR